MRSRVKPENDATIESVPITIQGKQYRLCFDLGALSAAETELRSQGHEVNLLEALPAQTLANTRVVFAAAIRKFHPEITFEEALKIPRLPDIYAIVDKIRQAWEAAMPVANSGDPLQAAE